MTYQLTEDQFNRLDQARRILTLVAALAAMARPDCGVNIRMDELIVLCNLAADRIPGQRELPIH